VNALGLLGRGRFRYLSGWGVRHEVTVRTLNIIGCGSVGQTLGRLWAAHNVFELRCVLNRSLASGQRAVEFVGSGRAIERHEQLEPADAVMISTRDDAIEPSCRELCRTGVLRPGAVVFHCSGSLPSTVLEPAASHGARLASLHPVKSFAQPEQAVATFAGTYCALEGDAEACAFLRLVLQECGAEVFFVRPEAKTIYHAATVFSCNYLVALLEVALRCFEKADVPRETALRIIEPIVGGTVENVFRLGTVEALTGPIARGEVAVVSEQCQVLGRWDDSVRRIYQALGQIAADLSADQRHAGPEDLAAIREILECK
jgi:predicted short-subunit dehydrogenase-like oxidoreductase (DUF2520 family)